MPAWNRVTARIVPGHRVASGLNGDPRFPGGTLRMQMPVFARLGLDLSAFHPGTLNASIAPLTYRLAQPRLTFEHVPWHPTEPAETFSFIDCRLLVPKSGPIHGFVYFPHPETKPEHFQPPDILELLMPWVEGLAYDQPVQIEVDRDQLVIE